ncbi:MAG: GNAT family N-acetyltransferase [Collimonas sp.]|uniref:GNAT family N-acetyltransferase n=1 Tax=Collimonas sp. TaxID=1963772 RepID=UPI003265AF3E
MDLALLERWLTGWSLGRGLPLPTRRGDGLYVEVGQPKQLRRYVFVDAGAGLQHCAEQVSEACVFVKAAVTSEILRAALPARWQIEPLQYVMVGPQPMPRPVQLPTGYRNTVGVENAGHVVRVENARGELAAIGRVALHQGCAVFDRIETSESHRRKGLGTVVMYALDALAQQAGTTERLLVASDAGRALYETFGWRVVAPLATAVLAA